MAQPYCTMACNDHVNVSLGVTCESEIPFDMIVEDGSNDATCLPNGPQAFVVTVMNASNTAPLPTSPNVTAANIGQTLPVKVKHWATGNLCWATITIEDKLAPQVTCPPNQTIACTAPITSNFTGLPTISDCSSFTLSEWDMAVPQGCTNPTEIITRTFTATDVYDNSNSCTQTIFVELGNIANVVFPPNLDDIQAPALPCLNPNTDPDFTGYPMLDNAPIQTGGTCSFGITHLDQIIDICEGTYKIIRSWTVADWCTGSVINGTQIIKVKDDTGPTISCPGNLTVSTNSNTNCTASTILPSISVTDDCTTTFNVTITTPIGILQSNGGVINNLSLGNYLIVYSATDDCGNMSSCTTQLSVEDNTVPVMVCDEITTITLDASGMANVPANVFDDGTYDNCCFAGFQVRRMNAGCGVGAVFGPTAKFCCDDIGNDVQVELQGADCNGNTNSCMVIVHLDDNINPAITCPANVTIDCTDDFEDLDLTGNATAIDGCGAENPTFSDFTSINQCGVGNVTRTFFVSDPFGNSTSCSQIITLVDNTPVTINFPPDYTVNGCFDPSGFDPDELPAPFGFPTSSGDDCELLAYNHSDQIFTVAPPACFKIVRTWTVIDWCTYVPNSGSNAGHYQGQQILKVIDNEAPTITCPTDFTVQITGNDCVTDVTLPQPTIDDCSPDAEATVTSDLGVGFGPFQNVVEGTYTAVYIAEDGCGNTSSCTIDITVIDGKNPTPYCKDGLVITLMNTTPPMVDVWASDFDEGSFDNCPGDVLLSFSPNVNETNLVFNCDQTGENTIELWVTDAAGNQDFCETFVVIQDNQGLCPNDPNPLMVAGNIHTEQGWDVEQVMVDVNDGSTMPFMTGGNGNYEFPGLVAGNDYTITPEKNMNPLNGVTTLDLVIIQKHILGIYPITTPYKMIAADANGNDEISTLDLVILRRLILQIDDDFTNVDSWRFVDANYEFPEPTNPWSETFPEVYNINNLATDMPDVDFVAIKVGDLNGNAQVNQLLAADDRGFDGTMILSVENQEFAAEEEVTIDFRAKDFKNILGYQFTLDFDETAMDFIEIQKGALPDLTENNFGFSYLEEGKITTSWHSLHTNNLDDETVLFSLVFQSKMKMSLNKVIEISPELTTAEAYRGDGDLLDVRIQFSGEHGPFSTAETQFFGNQPNPFHSATIVSFSLPEAQQVFLTIYDVSGGILHRTTEWLGAGKQAIEIKADDLPTTGMMIYTLETEEEVFSGKMILAH